MTDAVESWLAKQAPEARAGIEALRAVVQRAAPGLEETIKWNAPSYADAGADRVTLGLDRKGGFRVVLHRGAAPNPWLAPMAAAVGLLLLAVLTIPGLRHLMGLAEVGWDGLVAGAAVLALCLLWLELLRLALRSSASSRHRPEGFAP